MPRGIYDRPSATERFFKYVSTPRLATECWWWLGAKDVDGYGTFHDGRQMRATHFVYRWMFRKSIGGKCVLHKCDNPSCVNPNHLFLGTKSDNTRDMILKGRGVFQKHPELACTGKTHPDSKLSYKKAEEIRKRYVPFDRKNSLRAIAKDYGVEQKAVSCVLKGKTWKTEHFQKDSK